MTKKEFNERVSALAKNVANTDVEPLSDLAERGCTNVFIYGRWCELNFERNLREDYTRKTSFTNDFSIAEWCAAREGMKAVADTLRNALNGSRDSIKWFAELIIVINLKAWEMNARGFRKWSAMYSVLYYDVKDLYFDWFGDEHPQHGDALAYYFDYVD